MVTLLFLTTGDLCRIYVHSISKSSVCNITVKVSEAIIKALENFAKVIK
jgi:hypothetical protein